MYNLMCGDCYKLVKQIPDNSVDLVYIDVPYYIIYGTDGHSQLAKRVSKRNKSISDIADGIDYSIFNELMRICKEPYIYIWCSKRQIREILNWFYEYDNTLLYELLVWCKSNPTPTMNHTFLPDIEYCLLFRKAGTYMEGGYDIKSKYYFSGANTQDKKTYNHPTIKPLQLVQRHIEISTKENDTILDCFMGSGTTGVACVNKKRNFIGIELNKEYFDMAENRIKDAEYKYKMRLF